MIQWKYLTSNDKSSTTNKPSVCTRQNLPLKPSVSKRNSTTQHPLPDTSPFHARINSRLKIDTITVPLVPSNAITLLKDYDIILDCTDNAPTRYLLSDTAVYLGKPLVSGGAERYGGQVCIYNFGDDGPCYRCRYPAPAAPAGGCQQTGILGVVTGVIGNLQALQTIKIITGLHGTHSSNE